MQPVPLKLCIAISESSFILPWSTPGHAKPTDLSHSLKRVSKWSRRSFTVQHYLLMKEHVASFASVSLCSPHEFLKNDLLFSTEWFNLESLPEQYSQNMGSLRNVPTNIWPLFSLVLFFLNFFLFWLFEKIHKIVKKVEYESNFLKCLFWSVFYKIVELKSMIAFHVYSRIEVF